MTNHRGREHPGSEHRGREHRGRAPARAAGPSGGHPEIWSHRGRLRGPDDPENTEAALEAAAGAGVDGVEIDVRRTADDELVLSHDSTVAGVGPIEHRAFRDLRGRVARLEDAYRAFPTGVVNVELKASGEDPGDRRLGRLAAEFLGPADRAGRTVVSSFCRTVLEVLPDDLPRALLSRGWPPADVVAWLDRAGIGGLHLGQEAGRSPMPARLRRWFEATTGNAHWIALWTPNTDDELIDALRRPYPRRAIVTDRPLAATKLRDELLVPPPGHPPGGPPLRRPSWPAGA